MSQDSVIMLIRQIYSALPVDTKRMPDEISGLSFAQICLLVELFELERMSHEPLSLSALAQETGFSKPAVCATLKKLRSTGYVQMQMDDSDNRRKEISLTRGAWEIESKAEQYISKLDYTLCKGISPNDLQIMKKALTAVLQNVRNARL